MTVRVSLADLRTLLAAVPDLSLPWTHEFVGTLGRMADSEITGVDRDGDEVVIGVVDRDSEPPWNQTAALIVAAVNMLPALVAAVEAAQADGVAYALRWMRDGRTLRDPLARDVDAFFAALVPFTEPEGDA